MRIGLVDVDGHNFPNLALMKLSAWHRKNGDTVEFVEPLEHYDKVYVSKIFGDEYVKMPDLYISADEVVFGGTGFAITIENGKEVYHKDRDPNLPYEIEHIYPDYDLYPQYTKDTAFGFLTRGCCNDCDFCIVSKKEGRCSVKVADLNEFWNGQKYIKLLDPNILACKGRKDLIGQLAESGASVDFTQGLDARFIDKETAELLAKVKVKQVHFAFDKMKNEKKIIEGLHNYKKATGISANKTGVYVLTNFETTIEEDLYRIREIQNAGFFPDVRIYRKNTAPQILKWIQRWCNSRVIYKSVSLGDFVPLSDGETMTEKFGNIFEGIKKGGLKE